MRVVVSVEENRFPHAASLLPGMAADSINRAILAVDMYATAAAPVDTGALRANRTPIYATASMPYGSITWGQDYGIYVHEGTIYMEARPFVQQAVDRVAPTYLADLQSLGLAA